MQEWEGQGGGEDTQEKNINERWWKNVDEYDYDGDGDGGDGGDTKGVTNRSCEDCWKYTHRSS